MKNRDILDGKYINIPSSESNIDVEDNMSVNLYISD